ncbi:MAG: VCBS repeat-containing protein, partial [Acidobacteriota bacterium]
MMPRFSPVSSCGSLFRFFSLTVAATLFAGMLTLPNSAHAQGLLQGPSPTLSTGTAPQGVAAADFNRSGWIGMVVSDSTNKSLKVYLGTGPNTFGGASTIPTCTNPTAVLAKDFNKDGYPDIVVACTTGNFVELFLNDGTGHFGSAAVTQAVNRPVSLAEGDFTGNGLMDIAIASSTGSVTVILDLGNSSSVTTIAVSGTLTGLVAGDFNHDGRLDLAISDSANNNVHILAGNGSGGFSALGNYSTGAGTKPSGIVAADFNTDGNLDLAT